MQDGSPTSLGVPILERRRGSFAPPVCEPVRLLEVDVGGYDPEFFTLLEESIQLLAVTNAVREFTPLRLPRNRRFILVETDVVIGGGVWVRPD